MLDLVCEFVVDGVAASRGSKRAFSNKRTGKIMLVDGKNSYPYMKKISKAATDAMQGRPPVEGPVVLYWLAMFKRPMVHYRANGEMKADAPEYYLKTPDCSKIVRGIEDACSKICFLDDKQIIGYQPAVNKVWTESEPCTLIRILKLR